MRAPTTCHQSRPCSPARSDTEYCASACGSSSRHDARPLLAGLRPSSSAASCLIAHGRRATDCRRSDIGVRCQGWPTGPSAGAIHLLHLVDFRRGRPQDMVASVERVIANWSEDTPDYSGILACRGFALKAAGDHLAGEPCGRRSIELDPGRLRAAHAVAHVMESQGRHSEGIEWLTTLAPNREGSHNLQHHLWWHCAPLRLEYGDHAPCPNSTARAFATSPQRGRAAHGRGHARLCQWQWHRPARRARLRAADHRGPARPHCRTLRRGRRPDASGPRRWTVHTLRGGRSRADVHSRDTGHAA
jgi:hypothetical protein